MIHNQRIPTGVMIVTGILAIPSIAITASKDDASYDSPAGYVFVKSLETVDAAMAQVAHDLAISYQAKCRGPVSLGTLKLAIVSEKIRPAITILRAQANQLIPQGHANLLPLAKDDRKQYMRIITDGMSCGA